MRFSVTNDLITGNEMIDTQHRQLFSAINDFQDACSGGMGVDRVNETMKFLVDYTAKHFADEERLQQQSNYPDQPNHKKLHAEFKALVSDLASKNQAGNATVVVITQLTNSLGNWFMNHIMREDKKVAAHVRSQGM